MKFYQTDYGFEWWPVKVERLMRDDKKGWVILGLTTQKNTGCMQIYVTKTGKVRIYGCSSEWVQKAEVKK